MAARRGGEKEYMDDDEFQNPLGQGACDGSFSLVASPAVRLYHGPGYGRGPERERARQAGKAG